MVEREPVYIMRRADLMAAAVCGVLATLPAFAGIIGFALHHNVYTNLGALLASPVLWLTIWRAWGA